MTNNSQRFLGVFMLAMLSVSAIISLRNLPTTALLGTQSIFFFLAAGLCFFIPVALACAELASGWPKAGGVYLWVEEAYSPNLGFLAVWLQWVESVVWLPTILSFIAATTAYIVHPALEENKTFIISIMLLVLWGTTFLNFKGIKVSSFFSTFGVTLGTIIPGIVLIYLGFTQFIKPENTLLNFSQNHFFPSGDLGTLVTFTAILLGLCGMEIPAYHVKSAKNPQRDYPRAMFLATAIILFISILGSLAVAAVVPKSNISLIAGPQQAFHVFFTALGYPYASSCLAVLSLMGSLALLNTWIIGPSKGLLSSAEEGCMPKCFRYTNAKDVPVALLLLQAISGTILISLFVFVPTIKGAYWMINTLAAQIYMIMYFIVFTAVIRLRYKQPHVHRPYRIPGGKLGVWIVGGLGALSCVFALSIGFIRPTDVEVHQSASQYALLLFVGMIVCSAPPFVFEWVKKKYKA